MPEQIIDLLINYGAHPEQVIDLRREDVILMREVDLFTPDRDQILGALGMDMLIAQATLVLEDEDEEEEEEDDGKTKGVI